VPTPWVKPANPNLPALISEETLDILFYRLSRAAPPGEIHCVWHGGEPTLAGLNFYRQVVELQQHNQTPDHKFVNSMQTNGLLLNEEWLDFLATEGFEVGLSVDGSALVHDTHRRDLTGEGTYQRVAAVARLLKSYKIPTDLLCSVSAVSTENPLEVYEGLKQLGFNWMQFIPIIRRTLDPNGEEATPSYTLTPDAVTPESYNHFLTTIFDAWISQDTADYAIQLFSTMASIQAGNSPSLCYLSSTCGRVLVVEHGGSVYSCDHFVNPQHYLDSIHRNSLSNMLDSSQQVQFGQNKRDNLAVECRSCPVLIYCRGGCPKDRFATTFNPDPQRNVLCKGLKAFFSHAERPLRRLRARQLRQQQN